MNYKIPLDCLTMLWRSFSVTRRKQNCAECYATLIDLEDQGCSGGGGVQMDVVLLFV